MSGFMFGLQLALINVGGLLLAGYTIKGLFYLMLNWDEINDEIYAFVQGHEWLAMTLHAIFQFFGWY